MSNMSVCEIISAVLISIGLIVMAISFLGVFRFKTLRLMLHAASLLDTFGFLLVMTGLLLSGAGLFPTLKIMLVLLFMLLAAPLTTHLIAKMDFILYSHKLMDETEDME